MLSTVNDILTDRYIFPMVKAFKTKHPLRIPCTTKSAYRNLEEGLKVNLFGYIEIPELPIIELPLKVSFPFTNVGPNIFFPSASVLSNIFENTKVLYGWSYSSNIINNPSSDVSGPFSTAVKVFNNPVSISFNTFVENKLMVWRPKNDDSLKM